MVDPELVDPELVDPASHPITTRDARRYLVVANRTTTSESLQQALEDRIASGPSTFRVLVPAPYVDMSTIVPLGMDSVGGLLYRLTASQEAEELQFAEDRLQALLHRLRDMGATADGEVTRLEPFLAAVEATEHITYDEIIVSTLPSGLSRWLKLDLPCRIARQCRIPVTHVEATSPLPAATVS